MTQLDQFLFNAVHHFVGRSVYLDDLAIFFAQYMPYLMVLAFLVFAYYQRGWRQKLYLFAEASLAIILARGIVTEAIRWFYHRARPFDFYHFHPLISEPGWSFPSAHAAWFFALAMTLWYVNRKWGITYFILAIIMGVARVYAGVHWPADIVGGAIVGIICAIIIHWILKPSRQGLLSATEREV